MEADFLASNLSFENTDLEILAASPKSQPLIAESNPVFIQWVNNLFKSGHLHHLQIAILNQSNSTLRC
jgi:hypothetical protein